MAQAGERLIVVPDSKRLDLLHIVLRAPGSASLQSSRIPLNTLFFLQVTKEGACPLPAISPETQLSVITRPACLKLSPRGWLSVLAAVWSIIHSKFRWK